MFLERRKRSADDEQFVKFVEVIKKLYVNIPLLDAMQVPTYAKCIKDILRNKRALLTTDVVHLRRSVAQLYLILSWRRRKTQDAPPSHVQSEPNTLSMLFAIREQASASCQR